MRSCTVLVIWLTRLIRKGISAWVREWASRECTHYRGGGGRSASGSGPGGQYGRVVAVRVSVELVRQAIPF
jgi:hypothetical protein